MQISRKFSLSRISDKLKYESVMIAMSGEDVTEVIKRIEEAWQVIKASIQKGEVS